MYDERGRLYDQLLGDFDRDGRYGLWIDRNFYNGSSARCPAYDNEVLCDPEGSTRETAKFDCYGLELWAT